MSSEQSDQVTGVEYIKTPQGICKIVEMVISFVAVLLVGVNAYGSTISFFESAAAISIIVSVIFLALYITGYVEKIQLQFNRIQFVFNVVFAIYYLIAASLVLDLRLSARFTVGGIFGLVAVVAHSVDGFLNYKAHPLFK